MSLQRIARIAGWAALIALCIASARIFSTRFTAQETEPAALHGAAAIKQLKQAGQYESLQSALQQARLRVSRTEVSPLGTAAWHAPNPNAGYDAYVTESGVSIAVQPESVVSLRLHGLGYGAALRPAAPGHVSGDDQTITIERDGVREWVVNGSKGLEHGFTLDERPQSATRNPQSAAPLQLAMDISEGWRAVAGDDGQHVTLQGSGNLALEYGQLSVWDNAGRSIPARMTVAKDQIIIEVEDSEALYPLTIDPLFTQQKRLLAEDGQAYDLFGYTVALDGNTALIGAPYDEVTHTDQGSVYVFVRTGADWTLQQKLFAQDGEPGDKFGSAVAISGNTALIGAPEDDEGTNLEFGSAYVFVRSGSTWTFQQKLYPTGGMAGGLFGSAVALDGDTALVGAHLQTITPSFFTSGAAYVFVRNGTTWTQQQRLLSNDFQDGDFFGFSVALDGDTALVGAPNHSVTIGGQGAAYIFTRSGTVWIQQPRLTAAGATAGDQFGFAVALSGNKAVIGARLRELAGSTPTDSGMVISFARTAAGWAQNSQFTAPNPKAGAHFGTSLALEGDTLVVGASLALNESGEDQRSAYVFVDIGEWSFVRQFGPEAGTMPNSPDDRFGFAVALDGGTVLVGAYRSDAATTDQGAAYLFELHDSQHTAQPKLTAFDAASNDNFGWSVAVSGDIVAVGSPNDDVGANGDQGSVYVFTRNDTGWAFQQKLAASDGGSGDHLGWSVALDGGRLVAGAYGSAGKGAVYTFTRSGGVWTQEPKLTATVTTAGNFGWAVALGGGTLVVTAQGDESARGSAFVYVRNGTTWAFQQKLTANDRLPFDYFGNSVAISGDTVAVGAYQDDIGANENQGSAYVFTRTGAIWSQQQKLFLANGLARDGFGSAVALDIDTLVVGVPAVIDQFFVHRPGAACVFTRKGATWSQVQTLTPTDSKPDDSFGAALALSGSTMAVGGWSAVNSTPRSQGRAYVFTRIGNWVQQQQLNPNGRTSDDDFGWSVALSENTVVVGARRDFPGTLVFPGCAYTFVSPVCPALAVLPGSLSNGLVGGTYNQQLSASGGGTGSYQFAITHGTLPPGLTLTSSGQLQGTPTVPGLYQFRITTTHLPSLCTGNREYTLVILSLCPTLTVDPPILPDGSSGVVYSQTLTASGGTSPYTFTISGGSLPGGLSLLPDGTLTGMPAMLGTFNFIVTATDAEGCTGTTSYSMTVVYGSVIGTNNLQFYPLAHPVRLLDTRAGQAGCDAPGAKITAGTSRTQTAAGRTCDGLTIPANAAALVGNATSVQSGGGYFTLYPSDIAKPNSANSNYSANQILNSLFTVRLGTNDGAFKIFASTDTDIVVDITGYYAPPSQTGLYFHPLPKPVRLLDTRQGQTACFAPGLPLQGDSTMTQLGTTTCDNVSIPPGALALTGNATTVSPQANGFLTLYPSNAARPLIASANFQPGVNLNSPFMVGLAPSGQFSIYVASTTDLVVDVTGYYSTQLNDSNGQGLLFNALASPTRLLDTRAGQTACYTPNAPMTGGTGYAQSATGAFANVPVTAKAVVGNATAVNEVANGYLTFWPSNANQPFIATSNYRTGIVFNRHFTVGLGADGAFKRYAASTTDLVVDLVGYFAP